METRFNNEKADASPPSRSADGPCVDDEAREIQINVMLKLSVHKFIFFSCARGDSYRYYEINANFKRLKSGIVVCMSL